MARMRRMSILPLRTRPGVAFGVACWERDVGQGGHDGFEWLYYHY